MGNCQAAEAATVVIQHPDGKVERVYWSLSASQVMADNPGHYVAVIITTTTAPVAASTTTTQKKKQSSSASASTAAATTTTTTQVKHLKLLRPDDTLHIGHVYRLVSFEEVLREFASKRHVKLNRLLVKQKDQQKPRSQRRSGATVSAGAWRAGCSGRAAALQPLPSTNARHEQQARPPRRQEEEEKEEQKEVEEEAGVDAELEEAVRRLQARPRSAMVVSGGVPYRHGQWRPALQSISEVGSLKKKEKVDEEFNHKT